MAHISRLKLHLWTILAIVLDLVVVALVVITSRTDIYLPFPKTTAERNLQEFLPTFAALAGALIAGVNKESIMMLVTVHAKKKIASSGLTFRQLSWLHSFANGGVPMSFNRLFYIALASVLAAGFITTAIVNSLTPTLVNWGTMATMPILSFSADSGVTPSIYCETGKGVKPGYGYGIDCPLDNVYGSMFNAFGKTLADIFPTNETTDGVSYPRELLGISGGIGTLTQTYADRLSKTKKRRVLPTDTFDACLPRMVVTADCHKDMQNGDNFQYEHLTVGGSSPRWITAVKLCHTDGRKCDGPRTAPAYGNGMISVFRSIEESTGRATVSIFSEESYANLLTSPGIQCIVSATEELIPIRVTGNLYAERLSSGLTCPKQAQPPASMIRNVANLAGMTLEKMQGQDGKFESISTIPDGVDRIEALELAIERMLSVAATDMYRTINLQAFAETNGTLSQWKPSTNYTFATRRYRLGFDSYYKLLFVLSPLGLLALIIPGWLFLGFSRGSRLGFNPLDPTTALAAGMNRDQLPIEIANAGDVKALHLQKLNLRFRYTTVANGRMGIETMNSAGTIDPRYSQVPSLGYAKEGASPMPSPYLSAPPGPLYH